MKGSGRESVGAVAEVTASKGCTGNTQGQGEGVNGKREKEKNAVTGFEWETLGGEKEE